MRSVIFESSVSLDGFIEGPNGELDWLISDDGAHFDIRRFVSSFDTIFYGRKAYEKIGIPKCVNASMPADEREWYYALYGMRKYVFSRSEKHVSGNGMVVSENIEEEVKRIRQEDGKNIWFCGGADILRTFVDLDLVDEYILSVHPVFLKHGKRLFTGNEKTLGLQLLSRTKLKSGVIVLHYRPESRLKHCKDESRSF